GPVRRGCDLHGRRPATPHLQRLPRPRRHGPRRRGHPARPTRQPLRQVPRPGPRAGERPRLAHRARGCPVASCAGAVCGWREAAVV
ncbi:MAG: hypothetical protein AVDCRST_MAG83-1707, partial [uncultured Arthrobacter sp.]